MAEHVAYVCPGNCFDRVCQFCDGGLFACSVCGAFEGATTTDCLGEKVDGDTWDRVYDGDLDFRDGEWVDEGSPHSPNSAVRQQAIRDGLAAIAARTTESQQTQTTKETAI